MKFIVERAALLPALERAVRATATKSTLSALALVHLDTRQSNLRVAATSLEVSSSSAIGAVVLEPGFWGVDAKGLLERVKNMPETALTFTIQTKPGTSLRITALRTTRAYTMHALPGDDLPNIPDPAKKVRITYAAAELGRLLKQCLVAMSYENDPRIHLQGVWIDLAARPCIYSTDGHRLHRAGDPKPNEEALFVPRGAANLLSRMCEEIGDAMVELTMSSTNLHFTSGGMTLGAKRVEAHRVPFEQIIPQHCATNARVNRASLLSAVKSSRVVSDRMSFEIVRERGSAASMYIRSVGGADEGDSVDSVECELEGDASAKPVVLMGDNLIHALSALPSSVVDVAIGFGSELDPAVVTSPEFLAVLMPTRA